MNKNKQALLHSVVAMLLCISMLIGATFAWFTDSVVSGANVISTGTLKIGLYHTNAAVTSETEVTNETKDLFEVELWEPGVATWENFTVKNEGSLWLKYQLGLNALDVNYVEKNGTRYYLAEVLKAGVVPGGVLDSNADGTISREEAIGQVTDWVALNDVMEKGELAPEGDPDSTIAYGVVIRWEPGANDNNLNVNNGSTTSDGNPLTVDLGVTLAATQQSREEDSFGPDYDTPAEFPELELPVKVTVTVPNDGSVTTEAVTMVGRAVSATVPAGVKLQSGKEALTLTVTEKESSQANITTGATEDLVSLDVHIDGVDAANDKAIIVDLGPVMPKYLNIGNYRLYHVENGATTQMTAVATLAEVDAHNEFYYDLNTGSLTVALATFSEVALVADIVNPWGGEYDYSWYTGKESPYSIANADQLAAFGAIVGGMAKDKDGNYIVTNTEDHTDSFKGKTVKLIADINLGDKESENNEKLIFYPIGYYNNTGSYEKKSSISVTSSVSSFAGTFDGQGHTIANFYQNTWEMFGDYNDGYSGTPNHYKDAMGLFGYVYGGTVKNLTVDHFSSDGEFTPTGVIAAYADGNAAFENIAITNCNPRVYNTGNGGIIGIAGDTNKANDDHIKLTNITVDNSNKISALWGSYDVACGGLVGMYRGNVDGSGNATGDTISFDNCHVSAQMDVYNDVCGNYQYYAYRYAGMIIGSVRHNTTNADGKTIPNMTGISAKNCTVNYGDWNDYYYCEFKKNGHPSYSGPDDYKFSRVPNSEIDVTNGKENATCIGHNHSEVENNQAIYLPFHQLFTGYGWGVNSVGLEKYSGIKIEDFKDISGGITEGDQEASVVKFETKLNAESEAIDINKAYSVGDLFSAVTGAKINDAAVQVAVTGLAEDAAEKITATYTANTDDWTKGTLTFEKISGLCTVTIQDYNFCKPTTVILQDGKLYSLFNSKFTGDFLYRVGNTGTVSLGTLFAENGIQIEDSAVKVTVSNVTGTASGNYTSNATWENGTIQFSGTGVVKVTIQDETYCNITELNLEVVDATNVTTATSATANNVVLLKDCGFSSLEVSGGYTLYGNGFTMICASDSAALDMGYSFVTLNNGTLDNVQIVCPNFDYAVLYKSNMTESGNRNETTDKTRYFNVKSGVMASGNSQILNSRISGARAAVNVSGGNLLIDNSRIELGAVASVLVGAANSLTLRDVTLVQKPTASTYDSNKTLMGFSVLAVCNSDGDSTPITLEGTLVQNAWVDENDKQYVPSAGQSIVSTVLGKTEYLHDLNGDGTGESLNLGFAYMPESLTSKVNTTTITDNRTNKNDVPYDYAEVSILNGKTYVYSYKNTNGTGDSFKTESEYTPDKYGDIITVTYSDTADGLTTGKSFGTDGWVYELNVDLDKLSGYALDFGKLSMSVNGTTVTDFKVDGNAKPATPVAVVAGGTKYTLTATVDGKAYTAILRVTGTETSKESPSLVASNYEAGLCVASSYGGTWHGAAPALQGIQIKYWSVAEKQYKTITLSDYTPTTKGKLNGTNTTWTYSPDNEDFTLTLTGGQVHSGNSVNAMPVSVDTDSNGTADKLYFVAAGSNGLVNSGNTARTIPVSYSFKDNNNGDVLTFSHTWSVAENKEAQYNYSDFCNGTLTKLEASSGGGGCVTPETLVTLADGKQVRIDEVTYSDQLMVWDFYEGKYTTVPAALIVNHGEDIYDVIKLTFEDGTVVKAVNGHAFFDVDRNEMALLTPENAKSFVGDMFAKMDGNTYKSVKLVNCEVTKEFTGSYTLVSAGHYNFFVEEMFSLTNSMHPLLAGLEVGENMQYDKATLKADRKKSGQYTYKDFADYITYEQFVAFNGPDLKISVDKGTVSFGFIIGLISEYLNNK